MFAGYFQKSCIENSILPSDLKFADVTPVFKKKSKTSKDNYRPISILPNISKIYERCIYNQMQTYFDNLSKYQYGFRKGFNAQHCLVNMIEKWKESVDSGGAFGALMTDLSKAFDCLNHELLIAKLDAYGFDIKSKKLIQQYLSNRKQRVKVGNAYSSWKYFFYGIPQGSILGPLIFNIFLCDLFYFLKGVAVASYADDTTPYTANKTNDLVIKEIEHFSKVLFKWFDFNYLKINSGKSHILFSGDDNVSANIDNHTIISENKNELLGIILDSKLSFEDHINNLCKKASQKLNALARIAPYMCLEKRKTVMKAYAASQFGYCPLVWMFHSRNLNNKINSLHERALRITYGDRSSSFENLLKKDNSVSNHHRNMQALATEMLKVKNNNATEIMKELFAPKMSSYDLRNNNSFKRRRVKSVWYGTESVSYLYPKIWDLVPNKIKESEFLNGFKFKIKRWVPERCPCRICKIYLGQAGFIVT